MTWCRLTTGTSRQWTQGRRLRHKMVMFRKACTSSKSANWTIRRKWHPRGNSMTHQCTRRRQTSHINDSSKSTWLNRQVSQATFSSAQCIWSRAPNFHRYRAVTSPRRAVSTRVTIRPRTSNSKVNSMLFELLRKQTSRAWSLHSSWIQPPTYTRMTAATRLMRAHLLRKKNRLTLATQCEAPKYTTGIIRDLMLMPVRSGDILRSLSHRSQRRCARKCQSSSLHWYTWVMTNPRHWTVADHSRATFHWQRVSNNCSSSRIWSSSIRQTNSSIARNLNWSPIWLCSWGTAPNGESSKAQRCQTSKARGEYRT